MNNNCTLQNDMKNCPGGNELEIAFLCRENEKLKKKMKCVDSALKFFLSDEELAEFKRNIPCNHTQY